MASTSELRLDVPTSDFLTPQAIANGPASTTGDGDTADIAPWDEPVSPLTLTLLFIVH
jgi:hypothetical protein